MKFNKNNFAIIILSCTLVYLSVSFNTSSNLTSYSAHIHQDSDDIINHEELTYVNYKTAQKKESADFKESHYSASVADNFEPGSIIVEYERDNSTKSNIMTNEILSDIDYSSYSILTDNSFEKEVNSKENYISEGRKITIPTREVIKIDLEENTKESVIDAIQLLENNEEIISASPNYIYEILQSPNDPKFSEQWGLTKISSESAWNIETGSSTVIIGVLDTGIDGSHNDLKNRIKSGSVHRDFTTSSPVSLTTPNDQNGHGTHVAGIIAAQGNNSLGVTGVTWNSRLVSLRVLDAVGTGTTSSIISAINYANSIGLPIINLSLGMSAFDMPLYNEISSFNGLVVCAAGNNDLNTDVQPMYPASYDLNNIISVGASNQSDVRSNWNGLSNLWGLLGSAKSNYGKTSVDLFAPGTNILSTVPNNKYQSMSGTSMAAPFVSGVAGLALSKNPNLTTVQLRAYIRLNVDTISTLNNLCVTGGRLNAYKVLNAIPYPHTHAYTFSHQWIQGNLYNHRSFCSCGLSALRSHVVSSGDNGFPYKTCVDCGGPAEYGFVVLDNVPTTIQTSSSIYFTEYFGNDSFILSNGVIVLSDIDLESYYDGTLILPTVHKTAGNDCAECSSECIDCDTHCHDSLIFRNIGKAKHIIDKKEDLFDFLKN
ncbi:MAG TPA: S8 family peptidase [Bacilli bacterium]|nr:S8 family peptidase [Bacilli bacterium]